MGCFISKFRPKKIPPSSSPKDHQSCHSVQDKLVILSQVHPTPPPDPLTVINTTTNFSKRHNPIPTISSPSSASASSSTTTGSTVITNSTCSTSPLSSSCSSSIMSSRERSFSNEFLWSCIKENPHLIQVTDDPDVKMTSRENNSFSKKFEPPNKSSTSSSAPVVKQQTSNCLPPKKHTEHQSILRRRPPPSSCGYSPVISRQKSFRRLELPQPCPEKNYNNNLVPASRTTNVSPLTRRINSSATYYSHSSPLRGRNANGDTTSKPLSRNSSPLRNRDTNGDTRKAISRGSSPNRKYNNRDHYDQFGLSNKQKGNKHNVPNHDRYYYPASPSSSSSSSVRHNNKENFPMPRSQRFNKSCELQKRETASCATSRRVCPLNDHADGNGHEDIRNSPSSSPVLGEVIHSHQEYLDSIHQIDDDDNDHGLDNPHISLDCFIFL